MIGLKVIDDVTQFYNESMGRADPRVLSLPLAQSPGPFLSILLLYLLVVWWGPRIMEPYKPLKLRGVLIFYNFAMVLVNFWIFFTASKIAIQERYSLVCEPVDYSNTPVALEAMLVGWMFFFSKLIELADTVFFILRKKNSQISFLHVYHHATIVIVTWSGMKWVPGGQSFANPLLNSLIHVIMYIYYGMSAIGPHMQKYLWWKRYLTILQLTQFVLLMSHTGVNLFAECDFPKLFDQLLLAYLLTILALFLNFYFRAYIQGKRPPPSSSSNSRDKTKKA